MTSNGGRDSIGGSGPRISRERSESPTPSTHAPNMMVSSVRIVIGSPEKGVRMIKMPRRMRILERDMTSIISWHDDNDKFPSHMIGMSKEICLQLLRGSRDHFLMHLGELTGNDDSRYVEFLKFFE